MPTPESLTNRLSRRAASLNIEADEDLIARLASYFELLQRWNEKINLTSLGDTDESVDRLIMEPLAAARFLPRGGRLIDIGSGGGSPAIPLAIALRTTAITMVESRGRKAAFLREAVRTLGLTGSVETDRAEALAARSELTKSADVISLRAVRLTSQLAFAFSTMLASDGVLAVFSKHSEAIPDGFKPAGAHLLVPATQSVLHRFYIN
jgi:16S rRNA (guanine527-N7)-methyltransferase